MDKTAAKDIRTKHTFSRCLSRLLANRFLYPARLAQSAISVRARVPVEGLARAGWQMVWADKRSPLDLAAVDPDKPSLNLFHSLGTSVGKEGAVMSVGWGSAAFLAGLATSDVVLAVNGQAYTPELLEMALRENRDGARPPALLLRRGDDFLSLTLDVRGGPRHPQLTRIEGAVDRLADILKPR